MSYTGKGRTGVASFSPGKRSSSSKFAVIAGVGISLPTVAAIATALASPDLSSVAFPAVPLKGPLLVTFLAVITYFASVMAVTAARGKYKVKAPATTGVSEDFDRAYRAQMNMLEQMAVFLPTLWLSAVLVSSVAATVAGMGWVLGRAMYARGYLKSAAARGPGFGISFLNQLFLLVLSGIGIARAFMA